MWNTSAVVGLRHRLGVERRDFAKIVGVDTRTVIRWETGAARPSGASEAILTALREQLDSDPTNAEQVVAYVVGAAAIGGLAYLMMKLLNDATHK